MKYLTLYENYEIEQWLGNSIVREKLYHGSANDFEQFDYKKISKTYEGYGFYFTNNKSIVMRYADNYIYEVYLKIEKSLNYSEKEMSYKDLIKYIKAIDPDGEGYLSNWGDISHEGYNNVLKKAATEEYNGAEDDVEMIHSIINANGGDFVNDYKTLKQTLGYDGIIVNKPHWGQDSGDHKVYVAWFIDQIKVVNKIKVDRT